MTGPASRLSWLHSRSGRAGYNYGAAGEATTGDMLGVGGDVRVSAGHATLPVYFGHP
jgi:hypothetical protein